MNYHIGLDIGGTKIAAGLILNKKIIKKARVNTNAKAKKTQIINNIFNAIDLVFDSKATGIGIGIAGQIDQKNGILISSPNFSNNFKNVKIEKIINQKFKKPVKIENDANCFALGEAICGAGKGYNPIAGLTLGTGVGGGIIINKKIYHGKFGFAGEIGHMIIEKNGFVCSCGKNGHLEAYTSGTAMTKIYQKITGQNKNSLFVEEKFKQGEKNAVKTFKIMSEALACGISNIINILDPEIIVLGGGLSKVKSLIMPAIKLAKEQSISKKPNKTKIAISILKDDAAVLGAALLFN